MLPPPTRANLNPLRRTASDGPVSQTSSASYPISHSSTSFQIQNDNSDGEELAARYQMLEELGSGSFGVVYKAIEKATGEVIAVKHVRLPSHFPGTTS